tara:strand:- start:2799 stop:3965 length:1167 start_codon:yes stop_codon:yes gene_type:complete
MMKVSSFDEFSKLKTVILGTFDKKVLPLESQNPNADLTEGLKLLDKAYPEWYVDEVNEDIENFKKILEQNDVKVIRPKWPFSDSTFRSPNWITNGYDIYNVRDNQIIFGNKIISTPPSSRYRQNEYFAFYEIFQNLQNNPETSWVSVPKPSLPKGFSLPLNKTPTELELQENNKHADLSSGLTEQLTYLIDSEMIFDAANIIRIGRDILYLVSSTGNLSGYKWLKNFLGDDYRIHLTRTYRSSHLDSTICPLAPGLVLLNGDRVDEQTIPSFFKNWEKIYFSDVSPIPKEEIDFFKNIREPISKKLKELSFESPISYISSPWGGLNVFSISQNTVCVEKSQTKLIKKLESYKLNVIPVKYRHCFTMLGCLHCSTLDLEREGGLEDYQS